MDHPEGTVVMVGEEDEVELGFMGEDTARVECNVGAKLEGMDDNGVNVVVVSVSSWDPENDNSVDTTFDVELNVGYMAMLDVGICDVAVVVEGCWRKALVVRSDVEAKGVSWPSFFGVLYLVCPGGPGTLIG